MGYSLMIDEEIGEELASISGWGDFIRWAKEQDAPLTNHLCQYGWVGDPAALLKELRALTPPKRPDTRHVFSGLVSQLRGAGDAEVVTVTVGMGP